MKNHYRPVLTAPRPVTPPAVCVAAVIALLVAQTLIAFPHYSQGPGPTAGARQAAARQPVQELTPGRVTGAELGGGQTHSYKISLQSDQYLYVVVDQRGIDVVVKLYGPDGDLLREIDSPNGEQGPEPLSLVTKSAGSYRLDVVALDQDAPVGRYEVRIAELRPATPGDKTLLDAAETYYEKGAKLLATATEESRLAAVKEFEAALVLWRQAGERWREADTLNNLGLLYSTLGANEKALSFYSLELPIRRELRDVSGEAKTLTNIGGVYNDGDEYGKALTWYDQALSLRRTLDNPRGEADTLNNIGVAYEALGESQKALEFYKRVLAIRDATNDRLGKAQTLTNIGRLQRTLNEYQAALDSLNEAVALTRRLNQRDFEADALLNIGVLFLNLGEYQEALANFEKALGLQNTGGSRGWKAITLNNLGVAYEMLKDYAGALRFYEEALSLERKNQDVRGEAHTLNNMARIYSSLAEHQKALDLSSRAFQLMRAISDRRGEAIVLNRLGYVYKSLGKKEEAGDFYNQALALCVRMGDRPGEAGTLYNISSLERERGNLNEALGHIRRALALVELLRMSVSNQKLRESYVTSVQKYYDLCIELLMQLHQKDGSKGYDVEALRVSEQARARGLLELLAEARVNVRADGVNPALLEREQFLERELNGKLEYQVRLLSGAYTSGQVEALTRELDGLTTQYQQVEAKIREESPYYSAFKAPGVLSLKEIQQQADDGDTLLLEYAVCEERAYLWVITKSSIQSFNLPQQTSVINNSAAFLLNILRESGGSIQRFEQAATSLSRLILPEAAAAQIRSKKRLVVVADGVLQHIPFGALSVQHSPRVYRPLVAEHEVISLPSASTLAVLEKLTAGRKPAPHPIAVLADPVFGERDARVKNRTAASPRAAREDDRKDGDGKRLREDEVARIFAQGEDPKNRLNLLRLPGTREEAGIIQRLVPASKISLDFDANLKTATDPSLGTYRVIHFATHGIIPNNHPELAGVVLSLVNEQGESQQGYLGLPRVFKLNLPVELVVLSACDTAVGKDVRGGGLVDLTRGFMYAGSPRVVASLWRVREDAAIELMRRFYTRMFREGLSPVTALCIAQASMWREHKWSPSDWAGFVFFGDWK